MQRVKVVFDDGEEREYDFPSKEEVDADYAAMKEHAKSLGFDVDRMMEAIHEGN